MSNQNQQKFQDQLKERREEEQLFKRFQNVAIEKLERLSRQAQTPNMDAPGLYGNTGSQSNSEMKFGEEEQKILTDLTGMGLKEGIFASIASFVILRRGPKYIGRWIQQRQNRQPPFRNQGNGTSSYELSDPTKFVSNNTSNNPFHNAENRSRNVFPKGRSLISRSIWFVFDSVLSLMVGANVSVMFTDKEAIKQQIVSLPLVSGRSLIADSVCDELVEELRKVQNEKNPTYERLQTVARGEEPTVASHYLDGIVRFCQNCERRRYVERQLREERGLEQQAAVKIPVPGVPGDGPRLVRTDDGRDMIVDKYGTESALDGSFSGNESWGNEFSSEGKDSNDSF